MPPFIALAIAGAGLYVGLKWLAGEWQRAADERSEADQDGADNAARTSRRASGVDPRHMPKDLGTLEWDATTGVYKPRKETAG